MRASALSGARRARPKSRREPIAFLATEFLVLAGTEFRCCFRGDRSVLSRQNSIRQGAHRER
jgi:hypothetical protein